MAPTSYSRAQVVLHWLTLLVMLGSFLSHEAMEIAWRVVRRGHEAGFTPGIGVRLHVAAGVTVLALTVLRIVLRIRHGASAPVEGQHPLITIAAASVHGLLYLVVLALPITGMATWFGSVVIMGNVHGVLFILTLLLVAVHVLAALFHQFVLGDNLLNRMRLRR